MSIRNRHIIEKDIHQEIIDHPVVKPDCHRTAQIQTWITIIAKDPKAKVSHTLVGLVDELIGAQLLDLQKYTPDTSQYINHESMLHRNQKILALLRSRV